MVLNRKIIFLKAKLNHTNLILFKENEAFFKKYFFTALIFHIIFFFKEKKLQQKIRELMPLPTREKIVTRREGRKMRGVCIFFITASFETYYCKNFFIKLF